MHDSTLEATVDVVKVHEKENYGIRSTSLSRTALGFVLSGTKRIHLNDTHLDIRCGDLFLLNKGIHYEENIISAEGGFEQIVFYLSSAAIHRILFNLNINYGISATSQHRCHHCSTHNFAIHHANRDMASLFNDLNASLQQRGGRDNKVRQHIKLNELIFLILEEEECCLKRKLVQSADVMSEQFAEIIYNNLFKDISVEDLAMQTNRSLTSFKKEFKRIFGAPPHRWIVSRRLEMARVLLLSTNKTVSEVGIDCGFSNISHFIKLFKQKFHATPSSFRQQCCA